MRKLLRVSAVALALFVGLPLTASASGPVLASAAGDVLSHTQTLLKTAGGNSTFSAVDQVALTGGVGGMATDTYTFTVHPNGSITGHGVETCPSCTIGGRTGGYTEVFSFTATANFASFEGHFTVVSATGGLAGLRGQGTFQGAATQSGFSETVLLEYHFQP